MRYHQTTIGNNNYHNWAAASLNMNLRNLAHSLPNDAQPKRMRRTRHNDDAQITQDVMSELRLESTLTALPIGVTVKDGVATLSGQVDGVGEIWLIETTARRIAGVKGINMKMKIRHPEPGIRTDDDIEHDCEIALGLATPGPNDAVKVRVNNGWVSLSGNVTWGYERWMAEAAISQLAGVTGINSQITVR